MSRLVACRGGAGGGGDAVREQREDGEEDGDGVKGEEAQGSVS